MEKYADRHKISLPILKLERDILMVLLWLHIISKYILLLSITFGIKKHFFYQKKFIFLIYFIQLKQPGVKLTPKEHLCVQHVYRTLKTYHHVNFLFTQLSPLN